jgi:hypothetical protein
MMMVDVERGRAEGIALAKELAELDKSSESERESGSERGRERENRVAGSEDLFGH